MTLPLTFTTGMKPLKLIKYPGSKTVLLPEISKIFCDSNKSNFVDVFGGSGVVSLNVEASKTIYNDLNVDLYNLFKVIKEGPNEFLKRAEYWTKSKEEFLRYGDVLKKVGSINIDEYDKALRTFYQFNVGFGGMGATYRTRKEKSSYTLMKRIVTNFKEISSKVSKWEIENLDFVKIFEKYDSFNTLFFCDPPYSSKKWYEYGFSELDLEKLRQITSSIKGKFLITFDNNDTAAAAVFGKPNKIVEYENQNRKKITPTSYRKYSFYWNAEE